MARWRGQPDEDTELTLHFREDGTVDYTAVDQDGSHRFTAPYTADFSFSPAHLDILGIETEEVGAGSMLAIVEFPTTDRMRFDADFAERGSSPTRPTRFTVTTVEFTRAP